MRCMCSPDLRKQQLDERRRPSMARVGGYCAVQFGVSRRLLVVRHHQSEMNGASNTLIKGERVHNELKKGESSTRTPRSHGLT